MPDKSVVAVSGEPAPGSGEKVDKRFFLFSNGQILSGNQIRAALRAVAPRARRVRPLAGSRAAPLSLENLDRFSDDSMLSAFHAALIATDKRTFSIVTARFGLGRKPKKPAEIARRVFMSSADVRAKLRHFIKSMVCDAEWSGRIRELVNSNLDSTTKTLPLSRFEGIDPWFHGMSAYPDIFSAVLTILCGRNIRLNVDHKASTHIYEPPPSLRVPRRHDAPTIRNFLTLSRNDGLIMTLDSELEKLGGQDARIVSMRLGLGQERRTLEQISVIESVTQTHVRNGVISFLCKTSSAHGWGESIGRMISGMMAVANDPLNLPQLEAIDPWFLGASTNPDAFAEALSVICARKMHVIDVRGIDCLATFAYSHWASAQRKCAVLAQHAVDKGLEVSWLEKEVRKHAPSREYANELWHYVKDRFPGVTEDKGEVARIENRSTSSPQDTRTYRVGRALDLGWMMGILQSAVQSSDARTARIVSARLGLNQDLRMPSQIAVAEGVSKQRVDQIVHNFLRQTVARQNWAPKLSALNDMLSANKEPLTLALIEEDPWFREVSEYSTAFALTMTVTFKRKFRVTQVGDDYCLIRGSKGELEAAQQRAKHFLEEAIRLGRTEKWLRAKVHSACFTPELTGLVWKGIADECMVADGIVRGWRSQGIESAVRTLLSENPEPLLIEDAHSLLETRLERTIPFNSVKDSLSKNGLLLGPGRYGTERHIGLSQKEMMDIGRASVAIVKSAPTRQWHADELLEKLQNTAHQLPASLNRYTLNLALLRSKSLSYLGYFVWASHDLAKTKDDRLHVQELVVEALRQANRPLTNSEIKSYVTQRRGFYSKRFQVIPTEEIVSAGRGKWTLAK